MDPSLHAVLQSLTLEEREEAFRLLGEVEAAKRKRGAQEHFLPFVKEMWPSFIEGAHHKIMADAFEEVERGDIKRLIINMPPRHTKSEFASHLLPAWYLGRHPDRKVIQATHKAELAVDFGRKVRNLISSDTYHGVFSGVNLSADSKAAGRWNTNKGGTYYAIGVGGAIAGKGADLFIIDDPHTEQEAMSGDPSVYDRVYDWYTSGPRQRLQPGAAIVIVMTRWNLRDLTGRVVRASIERGSFDTENWKVIELPAILPSGEPLWPEFWPLPELEAVKREIEGYKWNAQYQQDPTSEEGAIVKREWWNTWHSQEPPKCDFVIQAWDTAYTAKTTSDYNACVTVGVWHDNEDRPNLILLDAYNKKIEFPELKREAVRIYKNYKPDTLIIEAKAAGAPLIQELRRMGMIVSDFTPSRGGRGIKNDKVSRVNAIADIFKDGRVWRPDTWWADEVVEQFAGFPGGGGNDDLVDAMTMAVTRFREGGFIKLSTDWKDDVEEQQRRRFRRKRMAYY